MHLKYCDGGHFKTSAGEVGTQKGVRIRAHTNVYIFVFVLVVSLGFIISRDDYECSPKKMALRIKPPTVVT